MTHLKPDIREYSLAVAQLFLGGFITVASRVSAAGVLTMAGGATVTLNPL